ncbi:MAG: type II secretion system protein [bacterium]|nr:type II secretion system protein [bacterium]
MKLLAILHSNKRGFTLVELLIVIAILSIMIFGIGGLYGSSQDTAQVEQTRQEIVQSLRVAHQRAKGKKNSTAHGVNFTLTNFTLYQGTSYATRDTAYDITTQMKGNIEISGLSGVNFTAGSALPDNPGTVTITSDVQSVYITVTSLGAVY